MFRPPKPLSLDGNVADNWKLFEQKFDNFLTVTELSKKSEETQVAVFLNLIGDDGLELFNTFDLTNDQKKSLNEVKLKFESHCSPKKNVIFERFVFNSISQKEGQSFDSFLTELRKAVKSTGYKDKDDMIRDRIVMGVFSKDTQERLLRASDLTLDMAIKHCRACEASKSQSRVLQSEVSISELKSRDKYNNNNKKLTDKPCMYCGTKHVKGKCPAYGKKCKKCQRLNHFATVCKSKGNMESRDDRKKKVHEVVPREQENSDSEDDQFYVSAITKQVGVVNKSVKSSSEAMWLKSIDVEGKQIKFKLDTGAEVSVLPLHIMNEFNCRKNVTKTNVTLVAYGSSDFTIKPVGEVTLECNVNGKSAKIPFIVVDSKGQIPLLGLNGCVNLDLVKRVDFLKSDKFKTLDDVTKSYPMVFEGLGEFPTPHKIVLKKDAVPHVQPIRRIPQALHSRVKLKLEQLEKEGIIAKVDKPTEWLNPLVIVEKKNKDLRLCLDPKFLNNAISREHFLIPTVSEIASSLTNKSYFSVLDMKDGYFQVKITDESADYCSFGTPFGRYRFLRLPFGIRSAPEVFQRKNYELFGDINGVGIYFDDLIITGSTEQEHDDVLRLVLERAKKYNIKFNKAKIQFKSRQVKFMGQLFSGNGIEPCESYIKAIADMPRPKQKSDVLRLLGMAKYLGKFVPNLSKVTAPLRNLTRLDVEWSWSEEHDNSLCKLKHLLSHAPVLAFFDPSVNIEIETDASKDGLGACLLQNGHPIAFSSRSLTKSEVKYAQIEKETLAIDFACQKFHYLIYGVKNVLVHSDHKPLVSIFQKDLYNVTPRLQRLRLRLLKYDLNVTYKPGKYLYIADTLSRAYLITPDFDDPELKFAVHSLVNHLPISEERKVELKQATKDDPDLSTIIKYLDFGWPDKNKIPFHLRHFIKLKDDLLVCDDLLFLGNKLVVPKKLQLFMLQKLHEGHIGMDKVKSRARQVFYWQHMSLDIENFTKKCKVCEKFARKNIKEPLKPYKLPDRPWQRISADIFSYSDHVYLVVYDAYSNWLELVILRNKSANEVILKLKSIFSKYGCPDELSCDNIPFGSFSMKEFSKEWNFNIVLRSPQYPQSNGLAEKGVGIAKNIVKKSLEEGKDMFEALLQYRNTPLKFINYSPAQLLMSRTCKTKVPISADILKPTLCHNVSDKLKYRLDRNESYFNKNAKPLPDIDPGQNVTVFNHITKNWDPGQILRKHESPRSYIVQTEHGEIIRRNRVDLRKSQNDFNVKSNLNDIYLEPIDSHKSTEFPVGQSPPMSQDNIGSSGVPDAKFSSKASPEPTLQKTYITRSGRITKPLQKLNL